MQKSNLNLVDSRVPGAWGSLLVLVGFLLIGMAVGNILAVMILAMFMSADAGSTVTLIAQLTTNPDQVPNGWYAMMILQGTVHFFSYLLPSLIYWFYIERKSLANFEYGDKPQLKIWILAFLLVFISIPINSKFIEWNANMTLPKVFSGVEIWMRNKEDQLAVMTKFLTAYDSFPQLLLALFVMVVLPALGEEVLFRGIIQRKLFERWRNIHLAVFVSAAIFSAIHFQFYGFLPRLMLGALFGYLYYWSGSIWVAIFAHFVNNGFLLIMMFLYNIKVLSINIEEEKTMALSIVIPSLVLTVAILYIIRRDSFGHRIIT